MAVVSDTRLRVKATAGEYEVIVGRGLLERSGEVLGPLLSGRRCALLTDDVVEPLYGAVVRESLEGTGLRCVTLTVPSGEASKTWEQAGRLLQAMSEAGLGRDSAVLALGGGVVGDLAGFVAAVYMRGVPVVQIPTTLLAQADSSIGGKTGVDLPMGKNLAGAFWAPAAVLADTGCIESLDDAEWRSGCAEVAKSAFVDGEDAVAGLERDASSLAGREAEAAQRAVTMAAGLKAAVVSSDERESGPRECLNLGHTLGHAIERVAGYGAVAHGVAVAEGLRFSAAVAEQVIGAPAAWSSRQAGVLDSLGLAAAERPWQTRDLLDAMYADKKVRGDEVRMVLSSGPGEWEAVGVRREVLAAGLDRWSQGADEREGAGA